MAMRNALARLQRSVVPYAAARALGGAPRVVCAQ